MKNKKEITKIITKIITKEFAIFILRMLFICLLSYFYHILANPPSWAIVLYGMIIYGILDIKSQILDFGAKGDEK